MHPQLILLALVAPLALSLPQPILQGESGALVARQESGNSTGAHHGKDFKKTHLGPPGGPHSERDLVERQGTSNTTGGAGEGGPHGFKDKEHHHGPPHPERDLNARQGPGNSTGGTGKGGPHDFTDDKHRDVPRHPERDLGERQDPANSTSGDEHHGDGKYRHKGHPGLKVDKRIEEGNGTTGGDTGKEKFKPEGNRGGAQKKPGEHERSIVDAILDRRQDNSTSPAGAGAGGDGHKHGFEKGHVIEHKGPE